MWELLLDALVYLLLVECVKRVGWVGATLSKVVVGGSLQAEQGGCVLRCRSIGSSGLEDLVDV